MDWETMQRKWQAGDGAPPRPALAEVIAQAGGLAAIVRRRDRIETVAALAVLALFGAWGWGLLADGKALAGAFALLVAASAAWIPLLLWRARARLPGEPRHDQPVRIYLERQRDAMRAQASLLERVAWWYVMPPAIGVIGITFALQGPTPYAWGYAAAVLAFDAWVVHINRRAARTRFGAQARQLAEQLRLLEESA